MTNKIGHIPLTVSYDIWWPKSATGKNFDSLSGHGHCIGCRCGKVVKLDVLQKFCSICKQHLLSTTPILLHRCKKTFDGSSGSMEQHLAVQLVKEVTDEFDSNVYIGTIVSDNVSKLLTNCNNCLRK